MGFPVVLVAVFFATLNFNPTALYAPSDYKNEDNFLSTIRRGRDFAQSLDDLNVQLEVAKSNIVEELKREAGHIGEAERARLSAVTINQIDLIRRQVESARETGQEFAATATSVAPLPQSALQADIIRYLDRSVSPEPVQTIASALGMSEAATERALLKLAKRHLVELSPGEPDLYARVRS